eukprot:672152-Pyramimonas_sp.AAC.1
MGHRKGGLGGRLGGGLERGPETGPVYSRHTTREVRAILRVALEHPGPPPLHEAPQLLVQQVRAILHAPHVALGAVRMLPGLDRVLEPVAEVAERA